MSESRPGVKQRSSLATNLTKYVRPHTAKFCNSSQSNDDSVQRPKTAGVIKLASKSTRNKSEGSADLKSCLQHGDYRSDSGLVSKRSLHNKSKVTLGVGSKQTDGDAVSLDITLSTSIKHVSDDSKSKIFQGVSEYDLMVEKERKLFDIRFKDIINAPTKLPLSMIGKCVRVRRRHAWNDANSNISTKSAAMISKLRDHVHHQTDLAQWQAALTVLSKVTPPVSQEDETDLDDRFLCKTIASEYDCTGCYAYLHQCKKQGIFPVSSLVRRLGERTISLRHHYLNEETVKVIAIALTVNTVTEKLDFSDNSMGDRSVALLAEMLKANTFIMDLDLSKNLMGSKGAKAIAEMLCTNCTLRSLNLSDNQLLSQDVGHFVESFKRNQSINTLDLSYNDLSEFGGLFVGTIITENDELHNLDLAWSGIRCKGSVAVMSALGKNAALQILDFSRNGLGLLGADALGKSLKVTMGLKVIDLSHNHIDDEGIDRIANGMKKNESIQTLLLSHNSFGETGCLSLLKSLETHPNVRIVSIEEMRLSIKVLEKVDELEQQGMYILHSGLNGYKISSPELSMCKFLRKILRRNPCDLLSRFTHMDSNKTGSVQREVMCSCLLDAGFLLPNRLMSTLMDEMDAHKTDIIQYKDLFLRHPSKGYQYSAMLRKELFPPDSIRPPRKLVKSLTFG